jgi:putative DNA primase/helicase
MQRLLAGRDVVLAPDPGQAGAIWLSTVGEALAGVQCAVRFIPPMPGKDLDDRLRAGEDLRELVAQAIPFRDQGKVLETNEGQPEIKADGNNLLLRLTDAGNGERFTEWFSDDFRFDHARKRWLRWRGNWWELDGDGAVERAAIKTARKHFHAAETINDKKTRAIVAAFAIRSESKVKRDAMLATARNLPPIADNGVGWDADPWLLACENGVLDLRTGELNPGRQEDRISLHVPIRFHETATAPRWCAFLEEVFEGEDQADLLDLIYKAIGYTLTGSTEEQASFWCYGPGANGKSVLLDTLRYILGPFAHDAGFGFFERRRGNVHPEEMAELAVRRLVTASEADQSRWLNEGRIKAVVHGDTTSAHFKYGKRFDFSHTAKVWLAFNAPPTVRDDSHGFWRSVRVLPFMNTFEGDRRDQDLLKKLKAEASGILAWAIRGCLDWQRHGLPSPACVVSATDQYRADSDVLADFLADCCFIHPDAQSASGDLYKAYTAYSEEQGLKPREQLSASAFGRRLGARFKRIKNARPRAWAGLKLKS